MAIKPWGSVIVAALIIRLAASQNLPPGYVDPWPVLKAASKAIGTAKLRCVTISGNGYTGMVGQQRLHGYEVDWPRGKPLENYSRTMNWENSTMVEEFDREPGHNPALWKYGLGWRGGTPLQQNTRQRFIVNGDYAWHQDGPGSKPVAVAPNDAERWQLDLWLNPHGFLKAAMMPGANPKAFWRWELGEMGRDGATRRPEKVTVVSITVLGRYHVSGTINRDNLLQRIQTWVPEPVLGDMNYEHEFSPDSYVDLGNGIRFPTSWHHHEGWDDNFQNQSFSAGHNAFGGSFAKIRPNQCEEPVSVPDQVLQATFPLRVITDKLAEGAWHLKGSSHNSVVVEFNEYVVVVEAPLDEQRNLAVIDEVARLVPNKPIRFLVNTHQHHDHIGGLRTYMHIGATIITHWSNYNFYVSDVLNYTPRTLEPDMLALSPPTELAEGYYYETVRESYWLNDGRRAMLISYVQPLAHVEGMLIAYLPREKILIEADLFNAPLSSAPPAAGPTPANRSLFDHVKRLGLEVEIIAPIHGPAVSWSQFLRLFQSER